MALQRAAPLKDIQAAVATLVGWKLGEGGRAADMRMFDFSPTTSEITTRWTAASWHLQCPWRLLRGGEHFTNIAENDQPIPGLDPDERHAMGKNVSDVKLFELFDDRSEYLVTDFEVPSLELVTLALTQELLLQAHVDAQTSEQWRLRFVLPDERTEHLVLDRTDDGQLEAHWDL